MTEGIDQDVWFQFWVSRFFWESSFIK